MTTGKRKTALETTFSALRHRNFRLYWAGQMISLIGTWMQSIGQVWVVLELTHSALQIGILGALQALPLLFFSLFGGVLADRWPKRRILLWTQAASLVQALLLFGLVASGTLALWELYLLALALGLTNCLYRPTSQAFLVELVGRDDVLNAVSLNSSIATLARIVGPALGGILIAAGGVAVLFLLNAASFLAVLAGLALINDRGLHAQAAISATGEGKRQTTWQSVQEGLRYVWRTPAVLLVIVMVGLVLLFGSNFNVTLPVFATSVLHAGAQGFGLLSSAFGAGSLIAAVGLAWRNPTATVARVLAGSFVFSALVLVFAVAHTYPAALACIAGVGCAETIFTSLAVTMAQTLTPDHLRGRVMSVYILFFDGSLPLGYILTGWLIGLLGVRETLMLSALLCLMTTGAGWIWWRQSDRVSHT